MKISEIYSAMGLKIKLSFEDESASFQGGVLIEIKPSQSQDKQIFLVLGQLFQAADVRSDAGVETEQVSHSGTTGPGQVALLFDGPVMVQQTDQAQTQHIDQVGGDKGQHIGRDKLPELGQGRYAAQRGPEHRQRKGGQIETPHQHDLPSPE